ncbi:transmembrane protein 234 isoform X4 [Tachypleus tridentatus]|uniref:transmembrane protein 234 isoform X3 n=1 Tax=Tachypleus tridentatus TaxID=6853 RepID=UPI003FD22538
MLPVFTSHGGGKSLYDFSYSLGLRRVSPMIQFGSVALLIVVSALWGLSTPWLRQGSAGIEHVNYDSAIKQWLAELWFLATNWRYVIPFLVNQSGSVLYAATLGVTDLSVAVPLTNALTFIFITVYGRFLGEEIGSRGNPLRVVLYQSLLSNEQLTREFPRYCFSSYRICSHQMGSFQY